MARAIHFCYFKLKISGAGMMGAGGTMMNAIEFSDVALTFGTDRIYDQISFHVAQGEFVCILGPSGCGKSTSLRLIGDLLKADAGVVQVNGKQPSETWPEIAFVFQSPRLAPWRTVISNVLLGAELRFGAAEAKRRKPLATELLRMVGLADLAGKYPLMLSGGERQRVSIARSLVVRPSIMLMDEPFSALDPNTRRKLRSEIERIWQETGVTVVFVTHDIDEAVSLADRIILLSNKPTRVLDTIAVDQARPRDLNSNPVLRDLRDRLHSLFTTLETGPPQRGGALE
jgi:NitT/TauT family transport system ATP-binding protein